MKNVEINEVKEFLICDYIYLPYMNKEDINLITDYSVFKCDKICNFLGKDIISPVSGIASGLSKIASISGVKDIIIIENDFKDKIKQRTPAVKDIYSVSDEIVKQSTNITKNVFALKIYKSSKTDLRDIYIFKDYTRELLETLNLIDMVYKNVKVKILLDKKDFASYQTLFNYMGTYPNIEIELSSNKVNDYEEVTVLELLDIYYKIKNSTIRDFTYITVETNRTIDVIKTKKYSNLKEILEFLDIKSDNLIINSTLNIKDSNFLIEDKVYLISVI